MPREVFVFAITRMRSVSGKNIYIQKTRCQVRKRGRGAPRGAAAALWAARFREQASQIPPLKPQGPSAPPSTHELRLIDAQFQLRPPHVWDPGKAGIKRLKQRLKYLIPVLACDKATRARRQFLRQCFSRQCCDNAATACEQFARGPAATGDERRNSCVTHHLLI